MQNSLQTLRLGGSIVLLVLTSLPARAEVIRAINEARADGCGGRPGISAPLRSSARLNQAARRLQRGQSLREAMEGAGYNGIKSSSVHISGHPTEASVARAFGNRFCSSLRDRDLQEIGYYRKDGEIWFVLAQPFSSLALHDQSAVGQRVLTLINQARSRARRCGRESFAPAGPVTCVIHVMPGQDFRRCRAKISVQAGPGFQPMPGQGFRACRAEV